MLPIFDIKYAARSSEQFANYNYEIYKNGVLVARYWHDFRGEEHGIELLDGSKEQRPLGKMTDFLKGGGPEPLHLTDAAIEFLFKFS